MNRHTHPEVLAKRLRAIRAALQASAVNLDHVDKHGSTEQYVSATNTLLEAATMIESVIAVSVQEERRAWDRFYAASLVTAAYLDDAVRDATSAHMADSAMRARRERFGGGPPESQESSERAALSHLASDTAR